MPPSSPERRPLQHSLGRLEEALARARASEALVLRQTEQALLEPKTSASVARPVGLGLLGVASLLLIVALVAGGRWLLVPALIVAAVGALALTARRAEKLLYGGPAGGGSGPRVGMGATVAADAILQEGSIVEMGATVGAGAVLEQGALVRMGASIGSGAVLERGALVSWGASVGEGAVVGAGATVAVGSEVAAGAHVPPHMNLAPGSTWTAAMSGAGALPARAQRHALESAPADPREAQLEAACDRLEAEFARAPEPVRAMFGESRPTLASLRGTCLELLARERALRAEASPDALARLERERDALAARREQASDEQVARSLSGAVLAIEAQLRQRRLFQSSADRLEAELTRLLWTVDGMGTELLRVRTAGAQLFEGNTAELARSVQQLQDDINSVAEALEEVPR